MLLSRLLLKQFRNYTELDIELHPHLNILTGENGQGKTNILESIYCLSLVKSFRTSKDTEMVQFGRDTSTIAGDYQSDHGVTHKIVMIQNGRRKSISLDGKRVIRHSDLIGQFPLVLFSPEDHRITSGTPAERRKFLDILLSQANRSYLKTLQEYQRILRQRNQLLALLAEKKISIQELEIWNETLAEAGCSLIDSRRKFLHNIAEPLKEYYSSISENKGVLEIHYAHSSVEEIETKEQYQEALASVFGKEVALSKTIIGPHRDDIVLTIDGRDVRKHASRGEQKSVLLALKLIELNYLKTKTGATPVLLLDDIYSELDTGRQKHVFETICRFGQTFITSATRINFPSPDNSTFIVTNGNLVRQQSSPK